MSSVNLAEAMQSSKGSSNASPAADRPALHAVELRVHRRLHVLPVEVAHRLVFHAHVQLPACLAPWRKQHSHCEYNNDRVT
jgi:hypothetical protein